MILLQGHPCLTRNQSLWLSIWFNIRFSSCLWFCIDYVSPCRSFCRYPHHIHRYVSEHIGVMSGHFFHFLAKERVVEWLPLASEYLQNHPAYIADPGSEGQTAMGKSWRTLDVERGFPPSSLFCFSDVENGSITERLCFVVDDGRGWWEWQCGELGQQNAGPLDSNQIYWRLQEPGVAPNHALEVQKGLVTYKSLSKNDPSVCTKNLNTWGIFIYF